MPFHHLKSETPDCHRLLLVEDEPMWQQAIPALIQQSSAFKVVAIASNMNEALVAWAEHAPDGLVTDWQLADGDDGLEVAQTLVNEFGLSTERVVLISGAVPDSIPTHSFTFIPKPQVSQKLLERLQACFQLEEVGTSP